jgi:hypothetical protein
MYQFLGTPCFLLANKPKRLKQDLKRWNKEVSQESEALWYKIFKYEDQDGGWCTKEVSSSHGVGLWKHIDQGWNFFANGIQFEVGMGLKVRFWQDIWCGEQLLKHAFPSLFSIARYKEAWVEDNFIWRNRVIEWNVIFVRSVQDWEMGMVLSFFDRLYSCKIYLGIVERIRWSSYKKGNFEVKSLYKALSNFNHEVFPWKSIKRTKVPL